MDLSKIAQQAKEKKTEKFLKFKDNINDLVNAVLKNKSFFIELANDGKTQCYIGKGREHDNETAIFPFEFIDYEMDDQSFDLYRKSIKQEITLHFGKKFHISRSSDENEMNTRYWFVWI